MASPAFLALKIFPGEDPPYPPFRLTKSDLIFNEPFAQCKPIKQTYVFGMIMPPTLKKLMGHIAFGACMGACVHASHFLYPL